MRDFSSSSCGFSRTRSSSSSLMVAVVVLVSLLFVSFYSSSSFPSWDSASSSGGYIGRNSNTSEKDNHVKFHEEVGGGGGGKEPLYNLSIAKTESSHISLPPVAAPSPAPEPAGTLFGRSESKDGVVSSSIKARKKDIKLERLELGLSRARGAIRDAVLNSNGSWLVDKDYTPQGPSYRNPRAFLRSYLEMEKLFRVYVYEEGEPPLFHDGPSKSIYSMEGRFIYNMETENILRTRNPDKAHVFFLPFSVVKMVKFIYEPKSFDIGPLKRTIVDYINVVAGKYPFWNRSLGADHFMLSCHDWGPHASAATPHLYYNSIRVLCNANTSEGFNPSKDATLPEINLKTGLITGIIGGPSASHRPVLAFFAGGVHGPIRPILLNHWKDKDEEMQVHEYLPRGVSYYDMMRKTKYCICPSGYEVASPRIVEAIYLECVPVIICDHYVLPFSDVLNWKAFSVQVSVEDIPNLKKILQSISSRQYIRMQRRVRMVQRHFVVNSPPKRFDVTHMILHSIWLRRLNVRIQAID